MEKVCNKIPFKSAEEAETELRNIVESNDYRTWKRLTPHRYYRCHICSIDNYDVFHLTSSTKITEYEN